MRNFLLAIAITSVFFSCDIGFHQTIQGNGNSTTETRTASVTSKIKSYGSFDVLIVEGSGHDIKVQADENLMPYIITEVEDGALVIKPKEHYNLRSDNKILVTVTTDKLELASVAGSGNINGEGKFSGGDRLKISIAGSGNVDLNVNTPETDANIAGSGNITLHGETKNSSIDIAGDGDYYAGDLLSENVKVEIAGSGNADVYAYHNLDIRIAGSGDINYKGNPSIKQSIAGSGRIKKVD